MDYQEMTGKRVKTDQMVSQVYQEQKEVRVAKEPVDLKVLLAETDLRENLESVAMMVLLV
ncbi:hypothetical protein [Salmonella sp. s54412]|uniref:hypothetical protein n=1 Tax=unclassified Salmonella TaxID=2614656 RepID=UPI003754BEC8